MPEPRQRQPAARNNSRRIQAIPDSPAAFAAALTAANSSAVNGTRAWRAAA
jgi:hypothetical protein